MNERTDDVAPDWLDEALRADGDGHRAAYVADDGFTARVAASLPMPAALPAWRRPALVALWAIAAAGMAWALPGAASGVALEIVRLIGTRPVSLADIATAVLALGVAGWAGAFYALHRSD